MSELKPVLGIITGLLVSFLVGHGYIDAGQAGAFSDQLNVTFGLIIATATAIFTLHRYVHLKPVATTSVVATPAQVNVVTPPAVVTEPVAPVADGTAI